MHVGERWLHVTPDRALPIIAPPVSQRVKRSKPNAALPAESARAGVRSRCLEHITSVYSADPRCLGRSVEGYASCAPPVDPVGPAGPWGQKLPSLW